MLVVSTLIAAGAAVLVYNLFFLVKQWFYIAKHVSKFPGRKGYPILGNLLDFFGPPDYIFKELRKYMSEFVNYGCCKVWLAGLPVILIFEPQDLEMLLGNVVNNEKGVFYEPLKPWLGDGLLTSSGSKWHKRRKLLTPTFHFNILQKFLDVFNNEGRKLVEHLKNQISAETDVQTVISTSTLNSICETAMGISMNNSKDGHTYRKSVHDFGDIAMLRAFRPWLMIESLYRYTKTYLAQQKAVNVLHNFSNSVVESKKKKLYEIVPQKTPEPMEEKKRQLGLLDLLLEAQQNGSDISDEGIREEVDTFVFEGYDTTSMGLTFALMVLANNRSCQDKIYEELKSILGEEDRYPTFLEYQELKYLERCIKESLRLYPSVPVISRRAGEEFLTKSGFTIPKNAMLVFAIYDLHRRADLYPDPEKFDPDRFLPENISGRHPYAYIPFSAGPRNCIGQKFAMLEMKCLLTAILKNFILEPIDTPDTVQCYLDLVIRPKGSLKVKCIPRK